MLPRDIVTAPAEMRVDASSQQRDGLSTYSASPAYMLAQVLRNRSLIVQMARREIVGRYKGSTFGLLWSFFNPLLMLAVYTFVFSVVFRARWTDAPDESRTRFALLMFVGMIVHGLFAEVVNRAPALVIGNPNFVKRVVFPLETLPIISLLAALFHVFVSIVVLLIASWLLDRELHATALFWPAVLAPLLLLTLGWGWILASLGAYLRDIAQVVSIATTILLFMTPVFYPVSALPDEYRGVMEINPLTFIVEQSRAVLLLGDHPDWPRLARYLLGSALFAWFGFAWFQRARRGFADVI